MRMGACVEGLHPVDIRPGYDILSTVLSIYDMYDKMFPFF